MNLVEFIYAELLRPRPLKALANQVIVRLIPPVLKVGPATIHLNQADPVVSGGLALGVYEKEEVAFFSRYCRGDITFIDIGANIGLFSALALHQIGSGGRVVCIEPDSESYRFLKKTIGANLAMRGQDAPRADIIAAAATAEPRTLQLHRNPMNRGDNRVYASQDTLRWDTEVVNGIPVDTLCSRLGIDSIGFVKIDVQGFEHDVIKGMKKTLEQSPAFVMMSEFWPQGIENSGSDPCLYLQDLRSLGCTVYSFHDLVKGRMAALEDDAGFIKAHLGRRYTTIVAVKGILHINEKHGPA